MIEPPCHVGVAVSTCGYCWTLRDVEVDTLELRAVTRADPDRDDGLPWLG